MKDWDQLTTKEAKAVSELQALGKRWPKSLTLVTDGVSLCVVHTNDPRMAASGTAERNEAILDDISGIPSDGVDW